MFFDGWPDLLRILVVGAAAYGGLIVLVRTTGKRTLSKMNAFDLIVTVAFGSILATIILNRDVSLSEGLTALALLCALQFAVAWLCVRSQRFQRLVKSEPSLLFFRGRYLRDAMKRERVSDAEILAAIRGASAADTAGIEAVVLETDGSFSVVTGPAGATAALRTVEGLPAETAPPPSSP